MTQLPPGFVQVSELLRPDHRSGGVADGPELRGTMPTTFARPPAMSEVPRDPQTVDGHPRDPPRAGGGCRLHEPQEQRHDPAVSSVACTNCTHWLSGASGRWGAAVRLVTVTRARTRCRTAMGATSVNSMEIGAASESRADSRGADGRGRREPARSAGSPPCAPGRRRRSWSGPRRGPTGCVRRVSPGRERGGGGLAAHPDLRGVWVRGT